MLTFVSAIEMGFAVGVCDAGSFHHSVVPLPLGGRLSCGVSLSCKGEVSGNRFKRGVEDVAPYG